MASTSVLVDEASTTGAGTDNMVKPMLQAGIQEVPEAFRQESPIDHPCPSGDLSSLHLDAKEDGIPVIDLSGWFSEDKAARKKVTEDIGLACQDWGFFQVVNHGVPELVMADALEVCKQFFDMPSETKQQYAMKPGTYSGYGRFYEHPGKTKNWNDVLAHTLSPVSLRNLEWPDKPPRYREVIDKYQLHVEQLGRDVYEILSTSLGLKASYLHDLLETNGEIGSVLRVNLYPPCPQPELALGTLSHSDGSTITILLQSNVPGLQIRPEGKSWVLVDPVPGALVVNVGDSLEVLSNGRYRSIEHRALVNSVKERFSLVTFFMPSWTSVLAPISELISKADAPRYGSVKFSDYFLEFFAKGPDGKTLVEALRLPS